MLIGFWHIIGIILVLGLITGVGIYSGSKVKDAKDFTTGGGKSGPWLVCGGIMGGLVSGQATIGTAQLAFTYGMSAWWFTLGSGIGCLILALAYVAPLRRSDSVTLLEIISKEYGTFAGYLASVLCSIGIFLTVIAQVLAACALITTILPVNILVAAIVSILLMLCYVVFGGAWGAGMGGIVKLILLYLASIAGLFCVWHLAGGLGGIREGLQSLLCGTALGSINNLATSLDLSHRFFSLVSRGPAKDLGSGLSLLVGVLSTQTYAQAIWTGKSDSAARKGSLLSAFLIPPIGIACTMIGLFMRTHCITQAEVESLKALGEAIPDGMTILSSTSQVFPVFIVNYFPALFGGLVLGTLFITVVGGGASLALGMATILVNDIYQKLQKKETTPKGNLIALRVALSLVLICAMGIALMVPGAIINDYGFLSMGIRGTVVFLPLTLALYAPGKIHPKAALASIICGPLVVLLGKWIGLSFDPLFAGMGACGVLMLVGVASKKRRN